LKELADIHFANAKTIVLVQDNLNIHSKASLYEAFPAAEARWLVERFEWHYWTAQGLPEAVWFESRRHGWLFQYGVVALLGFGWRDVADLQVATYAKSDTQSLFGLSAANCLFTLSSGHGVALSLIVVFIRFPRTTPCKPMVSRATVHRATSTPSRVNCLQTLRTP
jgi:hypothetical protein